ncbi:MAG: PEP/pyruvate-binding domain-containing protein [Crocinitomicaceae bacterium]|nr:PEP/pyruvate-binding domain-containing protein [Crocinitomicaceae bacterium]
MRILLCLLVMILWSIMGCSQNPKSLNSKLQFDSWASKPLYQKYGQVSSVKIVYETEKKKLHFVDSRSYTFHHEFCGDFLGYSKALNSFNTENYSGEMDRPFLLANINYYKALDKYALELGPSDRMNAIHLNELYAAVKKEVFFSDNLFLMMSTTHVNSIEDELENSIRLLRPDDVYQGQKYQPISKQRGKGRVRVITDWDSQSADIRPTDIILLKDIPLVFPLVSGVIVTEFQTPLSHVSLLGKNRKIPICAYTKLFDHQEIIALDGEVVSFTVLQDTFILEKTNADLTQKWKSKRLLKLKEDFSVDSLVPIKYVSEKTRYSVGNKAANFGELYRYSETIPFNTPESAFAIPFHFYQQHAQRSGINERIAQLVEKDNLSRSRIEVQQDLEFIRRMILNKELDSILLKDVVAMIKQLGPYTRMRFRSSTNAEDREGFSGAGIYTSKTGEIGNDLKPIDEAIKKVWASLWSFGAFMEREAFNIDHNYVSMGILVHRSFPNEAVNGVAITTNLYRQDYLGFVINAQLGDESVVQPDGTVQCDQFICYPDETVSVYGQQEGGIDIIDFSSLNNGKLVMTLDEIQELANTLELIKKKYLRKHYTQKSYFGFGLDLEFKLDETTRELYIKQMRVFNN